LARSSAEGGEIYPSKNTRKGVRPGPASWEVLGSAVNRESESPGKYQKVVRGETRGHQQKGGLVHVGSNSKGGRKNEWASILFLTRNSISPEFEGDKGF